jgi:branched-chain amino acid transport system ATP-binding protein
MSEVLLSVRQMRAGYGDAVVLDDISLDVPERGSLAVLGRNGVGKSTLLLSIMGYTEVSRGQVLWRGKDITGMQPHRRARAGLGWVAQEREIFPSLTVEENLTVASRPGRWDLHAVYGLFPRLAERRANMGNQLSGGEQQMLAVARTLMTNPALLLLDEPLEGLAPIIVEELLGVLGNVIHTEVRDMYLGRVVSVNGGLPVETPAFTLNRLCGTGLQAIVSAAQASVWLHDRRSSDSRARWTVEPSGVGRQNARHARVWRVLRAVTRSWFQLGARVMTRRCSDSPGCSSRS